MSHDVFQDHYVGALLRPPHIVCMTWDAKIVSLSRVSTKEVKDLKNGAFKCKSSSFLVHLAETTSFWSFWLKNMFLKSPARDCCHLLRL